MAGRGAGWGEHWLTLDFILVGWAVDETTDTSRQEHEIEKVSRRLPSCVCCAESTRTNPDPGRLPASSFLRPPPLLCSADPNA